MSIQHDNIVSFDNVEKNIDMLLAKVNDLSSQEGLNSSFIGRFFVSMCDTLLGICTTVGSNFVNITKSIKRSELHEFVDSNRIKVSVVDKIPYPRLVGFKVDVPGGLNGTYKNAIANISQLYIKLNALSIAKITHDSLVKLYTSITNGDANIRSQIDGMYKSITPAIKTIAPVVKTCQDTFGGKFQEKMNFDDVFTTKPEFTECQKMLLELEPRLQEVRTVKELTEGMEKTLRNITNYLTDNNTLLTSDDLNKFGSTIKSLALAMDGFNLAVTRHLALEHNYVIMINNIYAQVK